MKAVILFMMILLVDDQWIELRGWIEMLKRRNFEVELRSDAKRAFDDAPKMQGLSAAIIDVMISAPVEWADTRDGQATGLVLASKLRDLFPLLPIIFLTNQRDASIIHSLGEFGPPSMYVDKRDLKYAKLDEIALWLNERQSPSEPAETPQ